MKLLKPIFFLSCLLSLSGCAVRSIYVPAGAPVQLAEPVKASVWVPDKNGVKVKTRMTLPEGWWCLDDSRK